MIHLELEDYITKTVLFKHYYFVLYFKLKYAPKHVTRLQVILAMARNLSIGTRCKKDPEGEKVPKKD